VGGAVGLGITLQTGGSRISSPMVSLEFFIDINLSSKASYRRKDKGRDRNDKKTRKKT
jgi:hypothetical protein